MRRIYLLIATLASASLAQQGPYQALKKVKVGYEGGFDYVNAGESGRGCTLRAGGNPGRTA